MTASAWDVAAQAWEAWEAHGLAPEDLAWLGAIQSPALVVGAGQGLLVEALARSGVVAIGADWSRRMIERAQERRPGLVMLRASADELPFAAASLGTVIVATGVLAHEHPERTTAVLAECHRVTRPGGKVLVAMFALDNRRCREPRVEAHAAELFRARGLDPQDSLERCAGPLDEGFYDERAISRDLATAGFTRVERHQQEFTMLVTAER
jgi:demethylmenaquinone methyltransferase/2-methoxy-6-polyprenyl-1,4-benzoquinol methylase